MTRAVRLAILVVVLVFLLAVVAAAYVAPAIRDLFAHVAV